MLGMSKVTAKAFEDLATSILTKALGEGTPDGDHWTVWEMPYGHKGRVEITLIADSHKPKGEYRLSWLACSHSDPALIGDDGYMRAGACHPYPFSMSGKANYIPPHEGGALRMADDIIRHLSAMGIIIPTQDIAA